MVDFGEIVGGAIINLPDRIEAGVGWIEREADIDIRWYPGPRGPRKPQWGSSPWDR